MTRTVVLLNGKRRTTYQLPLGTELQDEYVIAGERWVVVAVMSSEDVIINPTSTTVIA